jgi:signal peptidase I
MYRYLILLVLFLVGCGRAPEPDYSLVRWDQTYPQAAALLHSVEIGAAPVLVLGTSMKPMIAEGDCAVVDTKFPYENIKQGDVLLYQARWLSPTEPMVVHMAAEKLGDEWIMKGINNVLYERGERGMGKAEYRGKVVQIYTKRVKP